MSIQLELPFPPEEIWKPVPGFERFYHVSNTGYIRRISDCGRFHSLPRTGSRDRQGYIHVMLCGDGNCISTKIHRVVMLAFVGKCPEGKEVNHINGVKDDNRLLNLEYITHLENIRHYRNAKVNKL